MGSHSIDFTELELGISALQQRGLVPSFLALPFFQLQLPACPQGKCEWKILKFIACPCRNNTGCYIKKKVCVGILTLPQARDLASGVVPGWKVQGTEFNFWYQEKRKEKHCLCW